MRRRSPVCRRSWLPYGGGDPLVKFLPFVTRSALFRIRFNLDRDEPATPPVTADFEFAILGGGRKDGLAFAWLHRNGFPLPSMRGVINARRFGPMVCVSIRAEYGRGADAAADLFAQSLGPELADKTVQRLAVVLRRIIVAPPRLLEPRPDSIRS